MMKKMLIALSVLLMVLLSAGWKLSSSRSFQFFGGIVDRVEMQQKLVALTFDDGPTEAYTQEILSILAEHDVSASFFLTGSAMQQQPHLARAIVDAGHQVGNHSFNHRRMLFTGYQDIEQEIKTTNALIRRAGQRGPIHFRPPYGKKWVSLPLYLSSQNILTVTWDVEPESYREIAHDPERITQYVLEQVRPGSIVLLHVMYPSRKASMAAVPGIISGLREQGYTLVTVDELLAAGELATTANG